MRYHIEWAYIATLPLQGGKNNFCVLYDEVEKDWSLTFPQAISLARRMGKKKYGEYGYEVTVTALDKCGTPSDKGKIYSQGRLLQLDFYVYAPLAQLDRATAF